MAVKELLMKRSVCLLLLMLLARYADAKAKHITGYIAQFDGDRPAAITYSFDDNLRDQYKLAVPMLNQIGFKGTFFVIPGDTADTVPEAEKKATQKRAWGSITWTELREMSAQGHEIASHTWSHPNLLKLSPEEVSTQFSKSYNAIKAHIGKPPLTVAFPFNASNPAIRTEALKYYVAFRAYQIGTGPKTTLPWLNEWADSLITEHQWGVVMTHAIAHGYAALSDPAILRRHFQYVKSRENEIWVDTFANISRYEVERNNTTLTLFQKRHTITCVLNSTLDPKVFDVPLTIVINVSGVHSINAERHGKEIRFRYGNNAIYLQATPSPQPLIINWR